MELEQIATRNESLMGIAEDVHDVLRLKSSERPGEQRNVEPPSRTLDRLGDAELHTTRELRSAVLTRSTDLVALRVDPEHVLGLVRIEVREAPVAATHLEHAPTLEPHEVFHRLEFE